MLSDKDLPYVSINMPIYNRSKWLPLIQLNITQIDYPKEKVEFVILDDSEGDLLFENASEVNNFQKDIQPVTLKYVKDKNRKSIGAKRNKLCKLSTHNLIACMDSDDLYFPSYLKYSINELKQNGLSCVGTAEMLFCFPKDNFKLTMIKCKANRQIHEASLVYTKKHFRSTGGFDINGVGEGHKMFDFIRQKNIKQLSVFNIMCCLCHDENTCNKDQFKKAPKIQAELSDDVKKIVLEILDK
jgi:glycosyltransferase involved in cell wall biosynthesis